jgi:hypothetical protein
MVRRNRTYRTTMAHEKPRSAVSRTQVTEPTEEETLNSATTIAALLFLAEKFPHRQFNSAELSIVSGIGRTAMSQIKNADDTPFSLGKCTMRRLDSWLEKHPGFKQ